MFATVFENTVVGTIAFQFRKHLKAEIKRKRAGQKDTVLSLSFRGDTVLLAQTH